MARVLLVIFSSILFGSIVKYSRSISAKTTLAPVWLIDSDVDIQLNAVVITSSPELIPNAFSAMYIASVPFAQETQFPAPSALANSASKLST